MQNCYDNDTTSSYNLLSEILSTIYIKTKKMLCSQKFYLPQTKTFSPLHLTPIHQIEMHKKVFDRMTVCLSYLLQESGMHQQPYEIVWEKIHPELSLHLVFT